MTERTVSERTLILLVAAVQFVNVLDFMVVMPLGPDFAAGLHIPASHLGYVGGSYTAAAAVAGLVGSLFLDRVGRRKALLLSMLGLVIGTALGGAAFDLRSLMSARVLAGTFGGPATSLAYSIIADRIPPERRGRAMGIVMGAFSLASVLGVPAGLELARLGGWRMPFFVIAALGVCVVAATTLFLPPLTGHLIVARKSPPGTFGTLASRPVVVLSWLLTAVMMVAGFVLIPNVSAYLQFNLGLPRSQLGRTYMAGGAVGLVAAQGGGRLVDRFGAFRVTLVGTLLLVCVIEAGFGHVPALLAPIGIFPLFVLAMGLRNVSHNTLTSRVPGPAERARFTSLQSAVQHFASAGGAFLSSALLTEDAAHNLLGMRTVTGVSIGLSLCVPVLLFGVERLLRQREGSCSRASAASPAN